MFHAERLEVLHTNYFTVLGELIAAQESRGQSVLRLDIGSPDLMPPLAVIARLENSAQKTDSHGYQSHRGIPSLRRAWADHYRDRYGVQLDPEREILPLIGTKEGIFHLSQALINPGDLVLVPDPGYQTYRAGARFSGGLVHPIPCPSADQFIRHLQALPEKTLQRAKLLWVNFPHNPTGATAAQEHFKELAGLARQYRIVLCHDSAYARVTYDGYRAPSLLETAGENQPVLEFNSLSKSHNMAGWRMGTAVGSPRLIQALHLLKTHADSGHFLPVLEAAVEALRGDPGWIEERNTRYRKRRDLAVHSLREIGITIDPPRGGLYLWFPIPGEIPSRECVRQLVEIAGVALTPGSIFGDNGEGFLRLSLTSPLAQLREGMERLSWGFDQLSLTGPGFSSGRTDQSSAPTKP